MQNQWSAYKQANRAFADTVLETYKTKRDMVWLHDYHLMLCPSMLKEKFPRMKVGWFLHTPFPSSGDTWDFNTHGTFVQEFTLTSLSLAEIYKTLPFREEVLRAVLNADLIGFHTYDYSRHFLSSCSRILGLEGKAEGVEDHGHFSRVIACPIGINVERFQKALNEDEVQEQIINMREPCSGRKVRLNLVDHSLKHKWQFHIFVRATGGGFWNSISSKKSLSFS